MIISTYLFPVRGWAKGRIPNGQVCFVWLLSSCKRCPASQTPVKWLPTIQWRLLSGQQPGWARQDTHELTDGIRKGGKVQKLIGGHYREVRDRSVGNTGESWEQRHTEGTEELQYGLGQMWWVEYCYGKYYREYGVTPWYCSRRCCISSWAKN